jgi:hypothetical protein
MLVDRQLIRLFNVDVQQQLYDQEMEAVLTNKCVQNQLRIMLTKCSHKEACRKGIQYEECPHDTALALAKYTQL